MSVKLSNSGSILSMSVCQAGRVVTAVHVDVFICVALGEKDCEHVFIPSTSVDISNLSILSNEDTLL